MLGPVDEIYVQENLKTFNDYGFEVVNGKITTVPQIGKTLFGLEDFTNLLENIKNDEFRLDKIHDIYASKACRTSVMIGESLTYAKMISIVENLAILSNPWKCPHGRPTFIILKELL